MLVMLFHKQQKSKFVYRGKQGCYEIIQSPILNLECVLVNENVS